MRQSREEILNEIKVVVKKDFDEWEGDYMSWVELITSDPPDRLTELFNAADDYGGEFCDTVYETVREAIKAVSQLKH